MPVAQPTPLGNPIQVYALATQLATGLEATRAVALGERKMCHLKQLLVELWNAIEPDLRAQD
jgi:hypothetical protein